MSENNPESNDVATKKLESSAEHAKVALGAAAEAGKAVKETVKQQAQGVYSTGKEHLTAAAKDLSEAANVKYGELRGQATQAAQEYKGRAQAAISDAQSKAEDFQSEAEDYIRANPFKALGIAVGVGFVLGVLFRR
jgi:ElaB/YqjD/DUF883 family membrane-anchored ribosome-binding protein